MAEPLEVRIRPLRRAEYDKLVALGAFQGERIELLEGRLVRMSPIGPPHSSAVDELTERCVRHLSARARVRVQSPFAALDVSEPEPDIAIVPLGRYSEEHPDRAELIIEVAESSLAYDRGSKLRVYAECGVPEYWIVNLIDRRIEVYRKPGNGRYWNVQHFGEDASVSPLAFPDFELRVADVLPAAK